MFWKRIIIELEVLEGMPVSRHVLCKYGNKNIDVHGFFNSLGVAYVACIYILRRCCHRVTVNWEAVKFRLVLWKSQTSLRLKLLFCLLLSKLLVSVLDVISRVITVSSIFCWSNDIVALWWIKQVQKRWNIWFQNRVNAIRANSSPSISFHFSSSWNPVDISNHSKSLAHLDLFLWFNDPQLLYDNLKNWSPERVTLPFGDNNLKGRSTYIAEATVRSIK